MRPSDLEVKTPWLPGPPPPPEAGVGAVLAKGAVGLLAGALFWMWGWRTLAIVVWCVAAALTAGALASPQVRRGLDRGFAMLGVALGQLAAWLLLAPLYLLGFSAVHGLNRLAGRDPLRRQLDDAPTFWLPAASERRRARRLRSLFAAERPMTGGRRWPLILGALLALAVLAEGGLRLMGYGDPVLYLADPVVGYYPAPDQAVSRGGKHIRINGFGMRSRAIAAEKPAGTLRVLVLGDSTAYGGAYVDQPDIYASRLERLLAKALHRPVEVLNVGVNGWGPFHALGYVRTFGAFDADVALITLPYKDLERPLTGLTSKPYLSATDPPRLALTEVAHHLMWRARAAAAGKPSRARRDRQAELGVAAYRQLADTLRAAGARVLVEVLPSKIAGLGEAEDHERTWVERLRLGLEGYPVGFPEGLFAEAGDAYHDPVHLAEAGHLRYAPYLLQRVVEVLR